MAHMRPEKSQRATPGAPPTKDGGLPDDSEWRWGSLGAPLKEALQRARRPGETIGALFSFDLDSDLHFREGVAALTSTRLLVLRSPLPGDTRSSGSGVTVEAYPLEQIVQLRVRDRGGLGTLDARSESAKVTRLQFTLGHASEARSFSEAFERWRASSTHEGAPGSEGRALRPGLPDAEQPEPVPGISTLFRLKQFARAHLATLVLGVALALGTTAVGLVPPYLTMPLVDEILAPYQEQTKELREAPGLDAAQKSAQLAAHREQAREPFGRVPWLLAGMLGAALAAWLLGWAQSWVLARLSERISADMRNTVYAHLQALSVDYFSSKRTGDLVSRIGSDTDRICSFLSDKLTDFASDLLMILGTAVMLFYIDPVLAIATLSTFPLVAWLTIAARKRLTQGFLNGSRAWAEMTSILADTIPGVRVVKAFAQERREIARFKRANERVVRANDRVNRLWTFFWPMVAMLNQLGLLVAWAFGAWRVYEQQITVGVLTAFLAYIGRFYTRLESMSRMAGATQRATASAMRIFEILDRAPSVAEPVAPVKPPRLRGRIEIDNVSFRFGNRSVLDGINLIIEPGEMVGLVGPTGAGKSTLLNLLCRFYDVGEGAIRVDGIDLRAFSSSDYRQRIGMVLQDPFLFYGTMAENIAYGRPEAARAEIIEAAKAAKAHDFILQLPDGYDSLVGERGQTLSGGERQRVSIARALLVDPQLLILDEATSSVDTKTEQEIQEALDALTRGRTTIAIAHRLSTLRNADRLVVIDAGKIAEMGDHNQLMAKGGIYARLYEIQASLASRQAVKEGA